VSATPDQASGAEEMVIQAELGELVRVGNWIEALALSLSLPAATVYAIQLCFEEAVSNIVRHGQIVPTDGHAHVRLGVERRSGAVIVTIEDHGIPFDPRMAAVPAKPSRLEDMAIGGQGIHLMRKFAQHMDYERAVDVNRLTLRFDVPAGAG
jgi:serine/threonine-protein kinase RsbW